MGGKALKKTQTTRKPRAEYERMEKEILDIVKAAGFQCSVPRIFPDKESFGDMDVLLEVPADVDLRAFIEERFKPTEMVCSGTVFSFNATTVPGGADFQIDFIRSNNLALHVFYFSFGDLGGILGRMANAMGLKLGVDGLYANVNCITEDLNDQTQPLDRIVFTTNPAEICSFLDLDYAAWVRGYASFEEAFDWVCASRLFKREYFRTLNHDHRRRANLRPMYRSFLAFVGTVAEACVKPAAGGSNETEIVENLQHLAIAHFGKEAELAAHRARRLKLKERAAKFNGHILMDQLGVPKSELKTLIPAFRASAAASAGANSEEEEGDPFAVWLDAHSPEEIVEHVRVFLETVRVRNEVEQ